MRLFSTLLTFSLFILNLTFALHPYSLRHKHFHDHSPQSLTSLQHRALQPLLDVCAYLDVNLGDELYLLGLSLGDLLHINICLCVSALPLDLQITTDTTLRTAVDILGLSETSDLLLRLIDASPEKENCWYPNHSKPICSENDVCGFECDYPYVRNGRSCVCNLPNTECNGICGYFPQGCSSALPRSLFERDGNGRSRSARGITRQSQAQATCRSDEEVCGVYGRRGFECVNTNSNLESCGGCMIPNPFIFESSQTRGKDCSSLSGVDEVVCLSGRCVVRQCRDGWNISSERDRCERAVYPGTEDQALEVNHADLYKRMQKTKRPPHLTRSPPPSNQTLDSFPANTGDLLGKGDTSISSTDCVGDSEVFCNGSDDSIDLPDSGLNGDLGNHINIPWNENSCDNLLDGADSTGTCIDVSTVNEIRRDSIADCELDPLAHPSSAASCLAASATSNGTTTSGQPKSPDSVDRHGYSGKALRRIRTAR